MLEGVDKYGAVNLQFGISYPLNMLLGFFNYLNSFINDWNW